jgi:hypothetical protein
VKRLNAPEKREIRLCQIFGGFTCGKLIDKDNDCPPPCFVSDLKVTLTFNPQMDSNNKQRTYQRQ